MDREFRLHTVAHTGTAGIFLFLAVMMVVHWSGGPPTWPWVLPVEAVLAVVTLWSAEMALRLARARHDDHGDGGGGGGRGWDPDDDPRPLPTPLPVGQEARADYRLAA